MVLTDPEDNTVDEIIYPPLNPDESYGRSAEDSGTWMIFEEPTPLQENADEGFAERLTIPKLTNTGGFYNGSVSINFAEEAVDNVYYTTDGTNPTSSSSEFSPPMSINETTILRLRAIEDGRLSSDIETHTYFIDTDHYLPVISLVTEPENLWSDEFGIYVRGTNGITGNYETIPANWNQDWEIPAHIEFYEEDNTHGFSSGIGTKIFGGCSRQNSQKSLSVFFRGEYGNPELEYPLFDEKNIDTFQAFVLRNSGNDFEYTHIRDAMMTTLIEDDTEIDYQAYQPTVVYLNGEYWGIHNMREKINEHFIASNHGVDADNIDLIENNGEIKHGQEEAYTAMMEAFDNADMQNQADYENVLQHVELESFVDYQIAEIFFANQDWPGNNLRYWRERRSGAKFRWVIYDTDFGFNLYGSRPPEEEMMHFATDASHNNPDYWPNPAWSTFKLLNFFKNDSFQQDFINRFADLLNTAFSEEHIINVIDSLSQRIEPEISAHQSRWNRSTCDWENQINVIKDFGENRQQHIASQVIDFFNIESRSPLTVNVSGKGKVKVNRVFPAYYPWTGDYFGSVLVPITAIPDPGHTFSGWSGASTSSERVIWVAPEDEPNLTASFKVLSEELSDIIINEIMYNAPDEADPEDWIEFYNPNKTAINISGWVVKDDDDEHEFLIPANTIIAEEGYLVTTKNRDVFSAFYSDVDESSVIGNMDFGLGGGGDQVRLYNASGVLADSVEYDDDTPWPTEADGNGYTLELKDTSLDNELAENWTASAQPAGTPTAENGITSSNEAVKEIPTSIALDQNYPNPFNPTTVIGYQLTKNSEVKLEIFDMLGRKVSTLINGE